MMKFAILGLLVLGQTLAAPNKVRRDAPILPAWDVPGFNTFGQDGRSDTRFETGVGFEVVAGMGLEAGSGSFLRESDRVYEGLRDESEFQHAEYGVPHEEYGVPHEEYGPPALKTVTEHICPEDEINAPFVIAPPAPEALPLLVPTLRATEPPAVITPYPKQEIPHEEYGPPILPTEAPYVPAPPAPEPLPLPTPIRVIPEHPSGPYPAPVTEHVFKEYGLPEVKEYVPAPPAPEPLPLPVPILRATEPPAVFAPYPKQEIPHEEHGPPILPTEAPYVPAPPAPEPLPLPTPIRVIPEHPSGPYPAPVTEHVFKEYGLPEVKEYVPAPPAPEPLPLPVPVLRATEPPAVFAPYPKQEIPHEEYGPPILPTEAPYVPAPPAPVALPLPVPVLREEILPSTSWAPYPPPTEASTEAPLPLPTTSSAPYPPPTEAPKISAPYPSRIYSKYETDSGLATVGGGEGIISERIVPAVRAPVKTLSYIKPKVVFTKKTVQLPSVIGTLAKLKRSILNAKHL